MTRSEPRGSSYMHFILGMEGVCCIIRDIKPRVYMVLVSSICNRSFVV